jgi:hypothetical protein
MELLRIIMKNYPRIGSTVSNENIDNILSWIRLNPIRLVHLIKNNDYENEYQLRIINAHIYHIEKDKKRDENEEIKWKNLTAWYFSPQDNFQTFNTDNKLKTKILKDNYIISGWHMPEMEIWRYFLFHINLVDDLECKICVLRIKRLDTTYYETDKIKYFNNTINFLRDYIENLKILIDKHINKCIENIYYLKCHEKEINCEFANIYKKYNENIKKNKVD